MRLSAREFYREKIDEDLARNNYHVTQIESQSSNCLSINLRYSKLNNKIIQILFT